MTNDSAAVETAIFQLLAEAGTGHTISATDVARAVGTDESWQSLFPLVRRTAVALALSGRLVIYRKGKPVDPADFKGVYRLGLPSHD
jgi:hypothetical protein